MFFSQLRENRGEGGSEGKEGGRRGGGERGEGGVNNCFKPLISSVFASRLKSEQKEKEK